MFFTMGKIYNSVFVFQPKRFLFLLVTFIFNFCFFQTFAQQPVTVDSSLLERIASLEQKVNYQRFGEDHFMMVGLTTFGFVSNKTTSTFGGVSQVSKTNSLADPDHFEFSPMFLWRHGNKLLLEFEPSFSHDQLGVNWAVISY